MRFLDFFQPVMIFFQNFFRPARCRGFPWTSFSRVQPRAIRDNSGLRSTRPTSAASFRGAFSSWTAFSCVSLGPWPGGVDLLFLVPRVRFFSPRPSSLWMAFNLFVEVILFLSAFHLAFLRAVLMLRSTFELFNFAFGEFLRRDSRRSIGSKFSSSAPVFPRRESAGWTRMVIGELRSVINARSGNHRVVVQNSARGFHVLLEEARDLSYSLLDPGGDGSTLLAMTFRVAREESFVGL